VSTYVAVSNFSIFFSFFPFFYFFIFDVPRGKCITQNYGAITRYTGRWREMARRNEFTHA